MQLIQRQGAFVLASTGGILWGYFTQTQWYYPQKSLPALLIWVLDCLYGVITRIHPSVWSQQVSEELVWAPWSKMFIDVTLFCSHPLFLVACQPTCPPVGLLRVAGFGDLDFCSQKNFASVLTIPLVFTYVRSLPGHFTNWCLQC